MSQGDDTAPLAIFDCSIFVQATLRGAGPAAACFELVESGQVRLVVSEDLLTEVRNVLSRPSLVRKYPQMASPRVGEFLAAVIEHAQILDPVPEAFAYPRDPRDQPYLDLAILSGSDYLVSRDRDLLDLQNPASEAGQQLRRRIPNLTILDPVELLRLFSPASEESA